MSRTEAGKRLVSIMVGEPGDAADECVPEASAGAIVAAIEAEARADLLATIRAEVEGVEVGCHSYSGLNCEKDAFGWCYLIDRGDVLAILDRLAKETPSEP